MPFELPELPFDREALGPHMSAETLDFHHGKHHKAYVDKVNAMVGDKGLAGASLSQVIRAARERGDQGLFNNSGQIWNHNFFCSTETLLAKLKDEAVNHFASGWAWLILDGGSLKITSLHDGDTPVAYDGMQPLLTVDVWEHAYYIDYRNARPVFVETVLNNLIDWEFVAQNLDGQGVSRADQEG